MLACKISSNCRFRYSHVGSRGRRACRQNGRQDREDRKRAIGEATACLWQEDGDGLVRRWIGCWLFERTAQLLWQKEGDRLQVSGWRREEEEEGKVGGKRSIYTPRKREEGGGKEQGQAGRTCKSRAKKNLNSVLPYKLPYKRGEGSFVYMAGVRQEIQTRFCYTNCHTKEERAVLFR